MVKELKLLEVAELVKAMEEEFGVSAAAPVAVAVAGAVVDVEVPAAVDIEVHLAVGAQAAAVNTQVGKHRKDVVNRRYCYLRIRLGSHIIHNHIGAGVSQSKHGAMNGNPLRGRLEILLFEKRPELIKIRGHNYSADYPISYKDMIYFDKCQNGL